MIIVEPFLLVNEEDGAISGFITARTGPAPPVYDSGGPVTGVDDFVVRAPELWLRAGRSLLEGVRGRAQEQGAAQVIVVRGPL